MVSLKTIRLTDDHRYEAELDIDGSLVTVVYPSVTTIVDDCGLRPGYEHVPSHILKRAGERGGVVHRLIELDLLGDLDEESVDPELAGYLESFRGWQHQQQEIVVWDIERVVCFIKRQYAGTLDFAGKVNGVPHLIDFKTREAVPGDGEQLAGYMTAYCKETRKWSLRTKGIMAVLELDKKGEPAKLVSFSYGQHCDVFDAAVTIWWTRFSRGLV